MKLGLLVCVLFVFSFIGCVEEEKSYYYPSYEKPSKTTLASKRYAPRERGPCGKVFGKFKCVNDWAHRCTCDFASCSLYYDRESGKSYCICGCGVCRER
jgi:hypothetical protein